MQKTKTATMEIRNIVGKLAAKYYITKGMIEIRNGDCFVQIILPPGTEIMVRTGKMPVTR